MRIRTFILTGLIAAGLPLTASAQFAKGEDAIKYRQSVFFLMSQHMGRIGAVAKGEVAFNAADVQKNAGLITTLSELPWQAFAAGTQGGKAKAAIWTEQAKFNGLSADFRKAAADLNAAAASGNLDQIRKAFGATGQSCKACHDSYRDR